MRAFLLIAFLGGLTAGCASTRHHPAATPIAEIGAPVAVHPAQQPVAAPTTVIDDRPLPVWRDTQIVKVRVAGYVIDKGEAFPESFKYVIADSGTWNLDALQNPERAYIPTENAPRPPSAPGVLQGTISPGFAVAPAAAAPPPARVLYDMGQIRLTGFFERGDEPKVHALADSLKAELGEVAIGLDPDLGWILMPRTAILPSPGGSSGSIPARVPPAAPKPAPGDRDIK
jgi:hypothetical protein